MFVYRLLISCFSTISIDLMRLIKFWEVVDELFPDPAVVLVVGW